VTETATKSKAKSATATDTTALSSIFYKKNHFGETPIKLAELALKDKLGKEDDGASSKKSIKKFMNRKKNYENTIENAEKIHMILSKVLRGEYHKS
jgi:hypothetical protein